jgi:hypothetical protein
MVVKTSKNNYFIFWRFNFQPALAWLKGLICKDQGSDLLLFFSVKNQLVGPLQAKQAKILC